MQAPGVVAAPPRPRVAQRLTAAWALAYLAAGAGVLVLLELWRGQSYWNFSEGVYLASAHTVLDGASIYTEVAAAQPPPLFLLGAGLMAIDDSLTFVRAALALSTLITGALVGVIVARLTGRPAVALGAALAALLTPWMVREHATLTPDALAAAPLLAAALLAARPGPRAAALGGVVAALAASLKLAFILPAAAIFLAARRRWAYAAGALLTGVVLGGATIAVWGSAAWENIVGAQGETGLQLDSLPGLIGQTIWNIGPLVALAGLAYLARDRARDPALFSSVLALLGGSLALTVFFLKDGTFLNTLVAVEPVALALAAPGLVWFVEDPALLAPRRRAGAMLAGLAVAMVVAQSASVLALPQSPLPFGNPFLSRAPGYELSDDQVDRAVRVARACAPGVPYSGSPFIAFVAGREVPGGQPDRFILGEASLHAGFRREIETDRPTCPYPSAGGLPEGGNAEGPLK